MAGLVVGSGLFDADAFRDESDSATELTEEDALAYLENEMCDGEVLLFLSDDTTGEDVAVFSPLAENYGVGTELIEGLVMCVTSDDPNKFSDLRTVLDNGDYFSNTSLKRLEARTRDRLGSIHMVFHDQFERNNRSLRQLYQGMAFQYGATARLIG